MRERQFKKYQIKLADAQHSYEDLNSQLTVLLN
jgi:hypothetical protein